MKLAPDSWLQVFAPETPFLEVITRGSVLYVGIIVLLRIMPRRTGGELAVMDLVFVLLIAEAAAHSMGNYGNVADGLLMAATVMGWNVALNFLSFRFRFVERLISAAPLQVVRDGRLLRRNMRREFLTEEELMEQVHREGLETLDEVKAAYIEGDGKITVIRRSKAA